MDDGLLEELSWDPLDDLQREEPSDDTDEDEADDILGELRPQQQLNASTDPVSQGSKVPSSAGKSLLGNRASAGTLSTGTFVSAKTSQSAINLGRSDVSSFGTSHFSSSPLVEAMSREMAVRKPRKTRDAPRGAMSLGSSSDYMKTLEEKGLLPSINSELNWSGREPGHGQHVEFEPYEDIPLETIGTIFCSASAKIERVQCRRIHLARKSMVCYQKLKLSEAMNEVEHLHKLRHAHIVQLVGSYVQGKTFAVLLYPVADMDLKDFLKSIEKVIVPKRPMEYSDFMAVASLGQSFGCLATALAFVHDRTTKHLDIKPRNVLVKYSRESVFGYHVYLADFGISRSFASLDQSQTASRVGRTAKYCAPEIYADEPHGRAADVFSLGCVFLEMLTILCRISLEDLDEITMEEPPMLTFHGNLSAVFRWIEKLRNMRPVFVAPSEDSLRHEVFSRYPIDDADYASQRSMSGRHTRLCILVRVMLDEDPAARITANELVKLLDKSECCDKGREVFRRDILRGKVDSSAELNRLLAPNSSISGTAIETILQLVVETGEIPLAKSLLRFVSANNTSISTSKTQELLRIALINEDSNLLKILTSWLMDEMSLPRLLANNMTILDRSKLLMLFQDFPELRRHTQGMGLLLEKAVSAQDLEITQVLLSYGFGVKCSSSYGITLLKYAVLTGDHQMVLAITKSITPVKSCCLCITIAAGFTDISRALSKAGTDLLVPDTCSAVQHDLRSFRLQTVRKEWPDHWQAALTSAVKARTIDWVKANLRYIPSNSNCNLAVLHFMMLQL
ncbi:kinase-like protein [Polyplosphaeria fusca]|uniref:Kinase-like protein n=1 Tax=Polyplosphaeria fusca TaxID=682080 RepID=A0A9P4UXB9_9PLEO|nr:kinase-like protein [Polyplosphaeria fusca]